MRSPADWRVRGEWCARLVGVGCLGLLLWRVGRVEPSRLRVEHTRDLPLALTAATRHAPMTLGLSLDSLPGPIHRDWVRALRAAGTPVSADLTMRDGMMALQVEPVAGPSGITRVTVIAGEGAVLRDAVGEVARFEGPGTHARVLDLATGQGLRLLDLRGSATGSEPVSTLPRRVRITGAAGWEGRFVAAALAEAGWPVETDFVVTPGSPSTRVRTRGALDRLDTATHAAVIIVGDRVTQAAVNGASAVSAPTGNGREVPPADLIAFVRNGGGLIVTGGALDQPGLRPILPATAGARIVPTLGGLAMPQPRRGLDAVALGAVRDDAVIVEQLASRPVVAARREQLGRVLALGYVDTWRWRMEGADGAPAEHARWWSTLVTSVARSGPSSTASGDDPTPFADLVASIGMRGVGVVSSRVPRFPMLSNLSLLMMALLALTFEWASRRTRGLP